MPSEDQADAEGDGGDSIGVTALSGLRSHPLLKLVRVVTVTFVLALLALLVWQVARGNSGASFVREISNGKRPAAPRFDLKVIWRRADTWAEAKPLAARLTLSPESLRGRLVVVNFWASWCGPCKDEAPRLALAARRYEGKVLFLGIDSQDGIRAAQRFLRRFHTNYPSIHDLGGTYSAYGLTGFPETFYFDRAGRVVAHDPGEVTARELDAQIRSLLRS